jgi:hypothetical protein
MEWEEINTYLITMEGYLNTLSFHLIKALGFLHRLNDQFRRVKMPLQLNIYLMDRVEMAIFFKIAEGYIRHISQE